jgi:hypothetical protein
MACELYRAFKVEPRRYSLKDKESVTARLASVVLVCLALLGLNGCTHYRYVQPDSEEGKQCVKKLDAEVSECDSRAQENVRSQKEFYDWQRVSYQACTHQMPSSAQMQQPCGPAPVDPSAAQRQSCRQGYKDSFTACGGRLVEVKND